MNKIIFTSKYLFSFVSSRLISWTAVDCFSNVIQWNVKGVENADSLLGAEASGKEEMEPRDACNVINTYN